MNALIIGGGIGGLTAAIALQKKGIRAIVFEQAPEIKEVGAGLIIAPNGMQILNRLNLTEETIKEGNSIIHATITDHKERQLSYLNTGNYKNSFGFAPIAIHRSSMQQLLLKKIANENVFIGKHFTHFIEHKDKVEAYFSDGSVYEGDFLIGADGIKSLVRKQLLGDIPYRYSGQTCWRGIAQMKLPTNEFQAVKEVWMGQAGLRSAYVQINSHQVYFFVTKCEPANGQDEKGTTRERLHQLTNGVASLINEVINNTDDQHIIRNDLSDFAPINTWSKGRIALLGDAAHATTPNLGQGANQAIESAYYIAESFAKNKNIEDAFQNYQKVRMEKAHYVTNRSWQFGQVSNYSSAFARALRNTIVRYTPSSITLKEFDKIYSLNY